MYTKFDLGIDLKKKLNQTQNIQDIANWAEIYQLDIDDEIEEEAEKIFDDLAAMAAGPEFERSVEELNKIADQLLNINLNPEREK